MSNPAARTRHSAATMKFLYLLLLHNSQAFYLHQQQRLTYQCTQLVPRDITFDAGQIEIVRVLGKIDVVVDKQTLDDAKRELEKSGDKPDRLRSLDDLSGRATSVRVFEGTPRTSSRNTSFPSLIPGTPGTATNTSFHDSLTLIHDSHLYLDSDPPPYPPRIYPTARIPGGNKCYLKEYLPIGMSFGSRELAATRKLVAKWNEMDKPSSETPPFPILLGSLKTDERIENAEFRERWSKRFPRTRPPERGNIWLIFKWDSSAFRSIKTFPPLPQVVEGLDYFRKEERLVKRWRFIRKMMRSGLEALDFVHRSGYCHSSVSSESLWMTTTNQQDLNELTLCITNLGTCQKFTELGTIDLLLPCPTLVFSPESKQEKRISLLHTILTSYRNTHYPTHPSQPSILLIYLACVSSHHA